MTHVQQVDGELLTQPRQGDAFEMGREFGASPEGWAGACPFLPGEAVNERLQWLDGFSAGRRARRRDVP